MAIGVKAGIEENEKLRGNRSLGVIARQQYGKARKIMAGMAAMASA
jgi:hypothetical protein